MPGKTIEKTVNHLIQNGITVATAESCTAGMIAAAIGDFPGVSAVFSEGFITYSNEAKEKLLGVPHDILLTYGAVSEQTARAMAEGVCKRTNANIGISATGIAGPDGGTSDKPVGLVYIGVCSFGETTVKRCIFSGDRASVRAQTTETAFALVSSCLHLK